MAESADRACAAGAFSSRADPRRSTGLPTGPVYPDRSAGPPNPGFTDIAGAG